MSTVVDAYNNIMYKGTTHESQTFDDRLEFIIFTSLFDNNRILFLIPMTIYLDNILGRLYTDSGIE